jgi:AcrR family transcriptional regulator
MTAVADDKKPRAANRPSRRHDIVQAAVDLFAVQPWELVTISSIVQHAGMTPAAFYYHFSSRDQLLEEVVRRFADDWVELGERRWDDASTAEQMRQVTNEMLDWALERRQRAMIFFLTAAGASLTIEDIRRDARDRLATAASRALRRITPERQKAKLGVIGLSLVVVCEMAARSELSLDQPYRTLGPRTFRAEVAELCDRVVGL